MTQVPDLFKYAQGPLRRRLAYSLAVVALFAIYCGINTGFYSSPALYEFGDQAANALQIENAGEGRENLGPYSRMHFHHPGPAYFYYVAWVSPAFGFIATKLGRYLTAELLFNALILGTVAWLTCAWFGLLRSVVMVACILAFSLSLPPVYAIFPPLSSLWGPHVVILPVTACVIGASQVAIGTISALPFITLMAIFAVHMHIATGALVVPVLGIAIASSFAWFRRNDLRMPRRPLLVALGILVLSSIPPIYEELTTPSGNLTLLAKYFWATRGSTQEALAAFSVVARSFVEPILKWTGMTPQSGGVFLQSLAIVGLGLGSVFGFMAGGTRIRSLTVFAWFALVLSVAAARSVSGVLYEFLFAYTYALAGMLYGIVIGAILVFSSRRFGGERFILTATTAIAGILAVSWTASHTLAKPVYDNRYEHLEQALALKQPSRVRLVLELGGEDHDQWRDFVAFGLYLQRRGYEVCVIDSWKFMFGTSMACSGDEGTSVLITSRKDCTGEEEALVSSVRAVRIDRPLSRVSRGLAGTPVEKGRLYSYDEEQDLAFLGWSHAESGWRWSEGSKARIAFDVDSTKLSRKEAKITISMGAFGYQSALLYLNQSSIGEIFLEGFEPRTATLTFPAEYLLAGRNELTLVLPCAQNGPGEDDRILGVNLRSVAFEY